MILKALNNFFMSPNMVVLSHPDRIISGLFDNDTIEEKLKVMAPFHIIFFICNRPQVTSPKPVNYQEVFKYHL